MKIRLPKTIFGLTFLFAVIIFCALAVTVAAAAVVKKEMPAAAAVKKITTMITGAIVLAAANPLIPILIRTPKPPMSVAKVVKTVKQHLPQKAPMQLLLQKAARVVKTVMPQLLQKAPTQPPPQAAKAVRPAM